MKYVWVPKTSLPHSPWLKNSKPLFCLKGLCELSSSFGKVMWQEWLLWSVTINPPDVNYARYKRQVSIHQICGNSCNRKDLRLIIWLEKRNFDMQVVKLYFLRHTVFILRNTPDLIANCCSLLSKRELIHVLYILSCKQNVNRRKLQFCFHNSVCNYLHFVLTFCVWDSRNVPSVYTDPSVPATSSSSEELSIWPCPFKNGLFSWGPCLVCLTLFTVCQTQ